MGDDRKGEEKEREKRKKRAFELREGCLLVLMGMDVPGPK